MEIVIAADEQAVADVVAGIVIDQVSATPDSVLGLATGSSPLPTYRRLATACAAGEVSFARCQAVTLDEYVGLTPDHAESYRAVIRREFVDAVDLPLESLHCPDPQAGDIAGACRAYDELVVGLGVDVQILGIGSDGHVAFNEPGSSLRSRTRIKTLTDETRHDNARFFASIDEVPRHVITQGLGTIGDAAHLVLVACGESKAAPIAAAVEGPITASCPASVLQWHPHVTVVIDEAAAAGLERIDYYRETLTHKPGWQRF